MNDDFPIEIEIQARIEVVGRNIFNMVSNNAFTYPITIIGKEADGYAPTVELGNYYGIIYLDSTYHLYKKKLVKGADKPTYKRSRIFSDKDLDRVVEELYLKLVHRRIKDLIQKRKALNIPASLEEMTRQVSEIQNPGNSKDNDI